ncbi:NAD-dependent succinate-semialdehyde dehydrogenase [Bordetella petrii]|uniref:NAD-dependent succinate-semialdehyde dehydrogenase n=1 Tax=Bordetella petrii TaxID=94624 RepID=UPI001A96B680|nr:NAD-dependent succinate-semialdehyde dehydrogenase [Bordetella petrii]MBO1113838.1 NAD-dependent succinate-semialdehyde dehydrogenase [Bordetella petrii]
MTVLNEAAARFGELRMLIDGEWLARGAGGAQPVTDPATLQVLGELPLAAGGELDRAVHAAHAAFGAWSRTPAIERCRLLAQAAQLVRERAELIAHILTLEQGKPLAESRGEVMGAAEIFEWYAQESRRLYGRVIPARQAHTRHWVTHEPVGPVAAFTPWNFPALTPARKIAGALAAGCTCVIKPAEETPATALELARACMDAGLPVGVLNVVFGHPADVSGHLIRAPQIRKITFTGSTAVGKQLAALAALHGAKRCTMELGGLAPAIVFDDADIGEAAAVCAASRFRNAGQVCVAASRFYVQRQAYPRFMEQFRAHVAGLKVGNGLAADTRMGPLANGRRLDAMPGFIDDALQHGGQVAAGGARHEGAGYFWQPTILADMPDQARAMSEETFGPVASVAAFDTLDEVIERANGVPYGLAAYAFTRSAATAMAVADGLQAGMVGINTPAISLAEAPFGGVKESGYGSEGGTEGLEAYLCTKFVAHRA